jgi:type IV fimbrial biogenesis protein FimT
MTEMSEVCNKLTMDKEPGFTLVELLITIVVLTILLAAGVPSFQAFIKNNRVTGQTNDLVSAIQLARSEALKRGTNAVVCASDDQATCTDDKDTWADGWIVFSDFDPSDGADPDVGTGKCVDEEDCVMATRTGLSGGSTLKSNVGFVRFLPTGLADNNVKCVVKGVDKEKTVCFTLEAKNCERDQARKVEVTPQGHTLVSTCTTCACS